MKKVWILLFSLILFSSCAIDGPMFEQPYIRSSQLLNQTMPIELTPILLPNSGSKRIRSVIGQQHLIQIISNPSTGYRWELKYEEPVKNCLDVIDRNMVYDSQESYSNGVRLVGSPGKQEWLFQTNCSGLYRLTFIYKRPWEQGPPLYTTIVEFGTIKE